MGGGVILRRACEGAAVKKRPPRQAELISPAVTCHKLNQNLQEVSGGLAEQRQQAATHWVGEHKKRSQRAESGDAGAN
jgi:hypothetical protein